MKTPPPIPAKAQPHTQHGVPPTPTGGPVVATYQVRSDSWVDIREAKPRCRAIVRGGQPEPQTVVVYGDGSIEADPGLDIDPYVDYPDMRNEVIL